MPSRRKFGRSDRLCPQRDWHVLPGAPADVRPRCGGGVGDLLRLYAVPVCPLRARSVADDGRIAVQHVSVPSLHGKHHTRARGSARSGDGGNGVVLRLLRHLRDPDGRLCGNRDRHLAPAVDECSLLAVAGNRGVGRHRVNHAGVSAVYHAAARSGISPRVGPGATVLVELERLLSPVQRTPTRGCWRTCRRGWRWCFRVHRDGFRDRRTVGRAQTTSRRSDCDLWRPRLAGVLGFVRPGRLPLQHSIERTLLPGCARLRVSA